MCAVCPRKPDFCYTKEQKIAFHTGRFSYRILVKKAFRLLYEIPITNDFRYTRQETDNEFQRKLKYTNISEIVVYLV